MCMQTRFQQHFGGLCLELGHLIYQHLFGHVTTSVDMETFVDAVSRLERVCSGHGNQQDAEALIFRIFTEGRDTLNENSEFLYIPSEMRTPL